MSPGLTRLFALACGLAVANLYYAQPLLRIIGQQFHVSLEHTSFVVTLTQLGYAIGLLLLVPLGDLLENRKLILRVMGAAAGGLLLAAAAPNFPLFCLASLLIGVTSVVAQILVPLAAFLARPENRGHVVGQVMSGLLLGILLARAAAGFISEHLGWRGVYVLSAIALTLLVAVLWRCLPRRQPEARLGYGELLASLWSIVWEQPSLRRRALYQVTMFGCFSVFWTAITYRLSDEGYTQTEIGMVALVGAAGALCAPWVGKMGDRGFTRALSGGALALAACGFSLTLVERNLPLLLVGAVLIDVAVQTTLILGQRVIYGLNREQHSRLNTLYISSFFLGGAAASAVAGYAYVHGGWQWVTALGATLPALGFVFWLTEFRSTARTPDP